MSKLKEMGIDRDKVEVMKLKVDGASNMVNTIREQQTAGGLSLVCPFPALEVKIPVSFGHSKTGDSARSGVIHRIGVEDDPESGLPRLRLSIRTNDTTRSTIISPPSNDLLDESSGMTSLQGSRTDVNLNDSDSYEDPAWGDLMDEAAFEDEAKIAEKDICEDLDPVRISPDPEWVGCTEFPMPDQLVNRSKTRKRRVAAKVAAWMMVLGFVTGGVYVLKEAGVVSVASTKAWLLGEVTHNEIAQIDIEEPLLEVASEVEVKAIVLENVEDVLDIEEMVVSSDEVSQAVLTSKDIQMIPVADMLTEEEPSEVEGESVALAKVSALETEVAEQPVASLEAPTQDENSNDEITIVLPTRWPAEYATAYRLRDPQGVVVDIPGALVKKEGWLEIGSENDMIRSVKAVQRETGARFVVFINGELPRFMTAPKTGGIALKLYRENTPDSVETQQIAMLKN